MPADLLDGGRPRRLIRQQGQWALEIVRLVSTGDGVFQPRVQRIDGRPAVIEALRRSRHGKPLVDGASRILGGADAETDASFDAVDGSWVPSSLGPSAFRELSRRESRSPAEAALRAEVALLRAACQGLLERVARLERIARDEGRGPLPARTPARAASSAPAASPGPPPSEAASEDEDAPAPVETQPEPLQLPNSNAVTALLKQLFGQDVPMEEVREAVRPEQEPGACVSRLVDDAGAEIGAIVLDAGAVARLGGGLLMLPSAEVDDQAKAGSPSEDTLMAASEVCNNLSGVVNKIAGNEHVRAMPLEPIAPDSMHWLDYARSRADYRHAMGGVLSIVAR